MLSTRGSAIAAWRILRVDGRERPARASTVGEASVRVLTSGQKLVESSDATPITASDDAAAQVLPPCSQDLNIHSSMRAALAMIAIAALFSTVRAAPSTFNVRALALMGLRCICDACRDSRTSAHAAPAALDADASQGEIVFSSGDGSEGDICPDFKVKCVVDGKTVGDIGKKVRQVASLC